MSRARVCVCVCCVCFSLKAHHAGTGPKILDEYQLMQFHVHKPAEHAIDDVTFDLELHYVHMSPHGSFVVIALLFVSLRCSLVRMVLSSEANS